MTLNFGPTSEKNLVGVHPDLIKLFRFVNKSYQCTILGGLRTIEEQKQNVAKGLSKTMNSKHLIQPDGYGHALDVAPDPVDFERRDFAYDQIYFAGSVRNMAEYLGIKIAYGGIWHYDTFNQNTFFDLDHFELIS